MNSQKLTHKRNFFGNSKKLKAYLFLIALPVYLYHSLAAKDYWAILFISCLALYAPALWIATALFLCYKTHYQFRVNHIAQIESAQSVVIHSLELNQLQKLSEIIEANPEILYFDYQRRSLIAWCRYYKNTRAQELIIQMMKKYPKTSAAA